MMFREDGQGATPLKSLLIAQNPGRQMNAESSFSLSWDGLIKGMTAGVSLLFIMLMLVFTLVLDNLTLTVGIMVLFVCILLMPLLWTPQGYAIKGNLVTVSRRIGEVEISVARAPKRWKWTWWGVRLFGSGGLHGYLGHFIFKGIGKVRMYATNRHSLVLLVDEKGNKTLVSPNEPERFIQQLRKSLPKVGYESAE